MTILIATTMAAFVMDQEDTWAGWLQNCDEIIESHDGNVAYFAALQTDQRGMEPFEPLTDYIARARLQFWDYRLDDGRTEVTTANRLRHITMGQNLCFDYACSYPNVSHVLFLAADTAPPPDIIPKMLEMNHPVVAPYITTYGMLRGSDGRREKVAKYKNFPVERGMASAAAIFVARKVFNRLRWRWDLDAGMSDDPCFEHDCRTLLGIPTYIRMDCIAKHHPDAIGPVEDRGHDMKVHR